MLWEDILSDGLKILSVNWVMKGPSGAVSRCQDYSQKAVAFLVTVARRNYHGIFMCYFTTVVEGYRPALPLDPAFGRLINSRTRQNRPLRPLKCLTAPLASSLLEVFTTQRVQLILRRFVESRIGGEEKFIVPTIRAKKVVLRHC